MLWPVRLPGGAAAIRSPGGWRASGWTRRSARAPELPRSLAGRVGEREWDQVGRLAASGLASPLTSSAGRLFDAVSALCGDLRRDQLRGAGGDRARGGLRPRRGRGVRAARAAARAPRARRARRRSASSPQNSKRASPAPIVAARFHNGLADAVAAACVEIARRREVGTVVLSGGTFQNRRLLERTAAALCAAGLRGPHARAPAAGRRRDLIRAGRGRRGADGGPRCMT